MSRTFSTPNLINAQTQARVLAAAAALNYRPRTRRSEIRPEPGVVPAASDAIGFQFFAANANDFIGSNTFYAPVLAGAMAEATTLGLHLLLHCTDRYSLSQELPKMVLDRFVGGMLLVGTTDPHVLQTFAAHVPHIVLVDNRDPMGAFESVISDGFGGAYAATRYLLELGHRRIAYYLSEPGVVTFQDRLHGYYCALLDAGLPPDPAIVIQGNTVEASNQHLFSLLSLPDPPTALLTANDWCALSAIRVCREAGRQIPDDISIIGFDDISMSQHTDVALTTLHVDKEAMGRLAVRRLYTRMQTSVNTGTGNGDRKETEQSRETDEASRPLPVCNQLPVSLTVRDSCRSLIIAGQSVVQTKQYR